MKAVLFTLICALTGIAACAQELSGRILDAANKTSLLRVSVKVNDRQTYSDSLGFFKMQIPKGDYEVIISHLGYAMFKGKVSLPQRKIFEVYLQTESRQLEDVIVSTGYQDIPKERATGSFSSVSKNTFNQQVTTGILERLEGITPALTVDRRTNSASIMVRGLSTLRSDRSPLIVVDQFPYQGDINNINPNDVENITILKDAAAASIWGAKAGNGVIVITTKKGKYNQKFNVQFNAATSVLSDPDLTYSQRISARDQIAVEQMLFSKGYYTSSENASTHPVLSPVIELLIAARDSKISTQQLEDNLSVLRTQDINQNYAGALFKTGINNQYSLSMQGGMANHNWLVTAGYDHNTSALSAKYSRLNLKVENNWKPVKNLDLGFAISYSQINNASGLPGLSSLTTATGVLPSYTRFLNNNGEEAEVMKTYTSRYTTTAGSGNLLDWKYYPISDAQHSATSNTTKDLLANLKIGYEMFKGLKLGINYQYENQKIDGNTINDISSYYTRNLINQFTQLSGTTVTRPIPLGSIVDENLQDLNVHNLRGQVNFNKQINDLSLDFLAGGEMREARGVSRTFRSYGVDAETGTSIPVDYVNSYRNFVTGSSGYISDFTSHNGSLTRYVSAYANGALSFKNRYTLSGSARRDASNLFGVSTNNLWHPLWSAGMAWIVSQEPFANNWPYLRLRVTYGSSGNSDSRNAALTTISYSGISSYTRTAMSIIFNYANPDLKWELTRTLNAGLDFSFFKKRLSGSVEYYIKKSTDLIGTEPIDYTIGVGTTVTRNVAAISARGIDVEMRSLNTVGKLRWTTDFFLNYYRDRVDDYYLSSNLGSNFVNGNLNIGGVVGKPVYAVYSYKWAGLNPANGNPRGYLNGVYSENYTALTGSGITIDDLAYRGPAFPVVTGALGNTIAWRGFNFNFRISYKFGSYFRRPALSYSSLYSNRSGLSEYSNRWQIPGDELNTVVPSQIYPAIGARDDFYGYSEATVLSGDLIRFQYAGVGYEFNKTDFKNLPFHSVAVQITANNLGLLWSDNDYKLDPDYPTGAPQRIYSFNLRFNL
ncbi:SusC/RagA family TonB-linked outer membrane protein [Pedobacter sp. BMA]|uniref:SusC/RagA family TonB-linked outer membrane protein n=1 Tax=Pedobacter sp. BMA TaxID=1663685 RepID=UPI000649EDFC|nr:SusC/RagA family TonB-linked outer membrane protein [Pedobacter sp. BMA]KLT64039.1 hypothetical protein AB669_18415 [Pedobacter sp. BMA]